MKLLLAYLIFTSLILMHLGSGCDENSFETCMKVCAKAQGCYYNLHHRDVQCPNSRRRTARNERLVLSNCLNRCAGNKE